MRLRGYLLFIFFILTLFASINTQDIKSLKDSIDLNKEMLQRLYPDMAPRYDMNISIPTINTTFGRDRIQYTKFEDFKIAPFLMSRTISSKVNFMGTGSEDIFSIQKTAIATYSPLPRLSLHSATTFGFIDTPFFGRGNYYILNAGTNYLISPNLIWGISGSYHSDFDVMPYWNIATDLRYMPTRGLLLEGSLGYTRTTTNDLNINQSAILLDLHARQRLTDDWYLNAYGGFPVNQKTNTPQKPMMPIMNNTYYGGTVEYWFKPTVGAEAGIIWVRDMFSGKMRAQPKLELKFRPGK